MPRVTLPDQPDPTVQPGPAQLAPEIGAAAAEFSRATYVHSKLSLREFEAARIVTAQINGCELCQHWRSAQDLPLHLKATYGNSASEILANGAEPDDAFYEAVADWRASEIFTPRERVGMELAERMALEPKEVSRDEDFWKRAHEVFSDAELVDLTYCISSWMALGRFTHILGFDDACNLPSRQ